MRFKTVLIENYRAIKSLQLENLGDMVVIAGPNGCGKSCVFDAIRLLKSVYGGYQPNEWHQFFGEFQLQIGQRPEELLNIFQDKTKPLKISVEIIISDDEKQYLLNNGEKLLRDQIWKEIVPELSGWRYIGVSPMATQHRVHASEVEKRTKAEWPTIKNELDTNSYWGTLNISTAGQAISTPSRILELIFSIYDPQNIGIVDYHGATRNYAREQVGGINLNIESSQDQMRQHALYNSANKYANLKTQMASGYVRNLLVNQVGGQTSGHDNLTETLKELFQTFFPGKEFLGPQPTKDGRLLFPVKTRNESIHDIDELSSGEKEVLYGYLRLRNTAPKNSVILLDEPELHLNPRLIHGLAGFYHRNLGKLLGNQIWLVTHSDTLIRESVGNENFSVFHMQPPDLIVENNNQVSEVKIAEDVERIVIDLVGDLAAYKPEAKIVIFEGGGDSQFDVWMVSTLFPRFSSAVNCISGGNKSRVQSLYELLEQTRVEAQVPARFFSITDKDGDIEISEQKNSFKWNVYHIENYLLEPKYVFRALNDIRGTKTNLKNEEDVENALKSCAEETIQGLVERQIRHYLNDLLLKTLDLGIDPSSNDIVIAFKNAIERSKEKFIKISSNITNSDSLKMKEQEIRNKLQESLNSQKWRSELRGRDILKRFVGKYGDGIGYEQMRELILARMKDDQFEPEGMVLVLKKIVKDVSVKESK